MYTSRRESKFGWDGTLYSRETRTRRVIYTSKQYPALTEDMTVVVRLGAGQRANIQSIIIIPDSWSTPNVDARAWKAKHTLYIPYIEISTFQFSIFRYSSMPQAYGTTILHPCFRSVSALKTPPRMEGKARSTRTRHVRYHVPGNGFLIVLS